MLDGVVFAQHIALLGVGEKEKQQLLADCQEWRVGEDRWESVGPLSWLFLGVPSGTAAVSPLFRGNAKGRLLSRAGLAALFALFLLRGHGVPGGRCCRYSERGQCPCRAPIGRA